MTETTTATVPLQEKAIYTYDGNTYIALSETHIVGIHNSASDAIAAPSEGLRLEGIRGSVTWANTLMGARDALSASLNQTKRLHVQNEELLRVALNRYEQLGEALLEKAEENSWCAEYEAFAEEWDLPSRTKQFYVTLNVTITARTEEDAVDFVENAVHLSGYSDNVVEGPELSATEVN